MLGHKSSIRASSPGQAGVAEHRWIPRLSRAAPAGDRTGQWCPGHAAVPGAGTGLAQGTAGALGTRTLHLHLCFSSWGCFFSACLSTSVSVLAFLAEMLDVPNSMVKLFSLKVEMSIKYWF